MRGRETSVSSTFNAVSRDVARARECPPVPKCTRLVPARNRNLATTGNTICPFAGLLCKPSDGLEPSTPSLPWRSRAVLAYTPRAPAITFLLQMGSSQRSVSARACPRVPSLMYPSRTRGALSVLKTRMHRRRMGAAPSSRSTAVRVVRALSERGGREGPGGSPPHRCADLLCKRGTEGRLDIGLEREIVLAGLPEDDRLLEVAVGDPADVANRHAEPGFVDEVAEPGDLLRELIRAGNSLDELLKFPLGSRSTFR